MFFALYGTCDARLWEGGKYSHGVWEQFANSSLDFVFLRFTNIFPVGPFKMLLVALEVSASAGAQPLPDTRRAGLPVGER